MNLSNSLQQLSLSGAQANSSAFVSGIESEHRLQPPLYKKECSFAQSVENMLTPSSPDPASCCPDDMKYYTAISHYTESDSLKYCTRADMSDTVETDSICISRVDQIFLTKVTTPMSFMALGNVMENLKVSAIAVEQKAARNIDDRPRNTLASTAKIALSSGIARRQAAKNKPIEFEGRFWRAEYGSLNSENIDMDYLPKPFSMDGFKEIDETKSSLGEKKIERRDKKVIRQMRGMRRKVFACVRRLGWKLRVWETAKWPEEHDYPSYTSPWSERSRFGTFSETRSEDFVISV